MPGWAWGCGTILPHLLPQTLTSFIPTDCECNESTRISSTIKLSLPGSRKSCLPTVGHRCRGSPRPLPEHVPSGLGADGFCCVVDTQNPSFSVEAASLGGSSRRLGDRERRWLLRGLGSGAREAWRAGPYLPRCRQKSQGTPHRQPHPPDG